MNDPPTDTNSDQGGEQPRHGGVERVDTVRQGSIDAERAVGETQDDPCGNAYIDPHDECIRDAHGDEDTDEDTNEDTDEDTEENEFAITNETRTARRVFGADNYSAREESNSVERDRTSPDCTHDHLTILRTPGCTPTTRVNKKRVYTFKKRTPRVERHVTNMKTKRVARGEKLARSDIAKISCCSRKRCFKKVDKAFLNAQVRRTATMSRAERRVYLEGMLEENAGLFFFDGRAVCTRFLEKAFSFSKHIQGSVKGTPGSRARPADHKLPRESQSRRLDDIVCFLERLASSTGDSMPDKDEQHLPYFEKKQVYEVFIQEQGELGRAEPPSASYFYETWNKHAPQIKVRKVHRFTLCGDCERFRAKLAILGTNETESLDIRGQKSEHLEMVRRERREYQKKSEKAMLYPNEYCSFIIDGADQSAYGLPHFAAKVKDTRGHGLDVKLIGVLEHGVSKHLSLYTMTGEYETGANHVIEVIHRALSVKWEKNRLPNTLFVQVDNCTRENKNRYFFSYMESLVGWGVFEEVYVSFLPIGHTHADIDQAFSCTSRHLRHHDAITMEDLLIEVGRAYNPPPTVNRVLDVINFSGLLQTNRVLNNVRGFTQFRYFRFHRVAGIPRSNIEAFRTGCAVRVGCNDEWERLCTRGEHEGFIRFCPDLSLTPPTEARSPPNFDEVSKRFISEETRVNDTTKMTKLRALRDGVYCSREESFHWNITESMEYNGRHGKNGNEEFDTGIGEEDIEITADDFEYETNEFVAVRVEATSTVPFWIGKILTVNNNCEGVISHLDVQWYEIAEGESAWTGKYLPCRLGGQKKGKPWVQRVATGVVLVKFSNLTNASCIAARDRKKIMESLNQS